MKFYKRFFTLSKSLEVAFVLGIACAFILSAQTANSAPNPELNYQGKLTDASNIAVPDGTYNMRFWLLTSPSIATTSAIWTESLTGSNRVQVTNGLFSVMLGSTSPLTSVDFDQALYLGVEIGVEDQSIEVAEGSGAEGSGSGEAKTVQEEETGDAPEAQETAPNEAGSSADESGGEGTP